MKVIDLLNKIANGEEVPEKIRINETLYWFDNRQKQYIYVPNEEVAGCDDIYSNTLILTYEPFDTLDEFLNTEVEIIEEDNKIEKLKFWCGLEKVQNDGLSDIETIIKYGNRNFENYFNKINELIDEVNKLKENK